MCLLFWFSNYQMGTSEDKWYLTKEQLANTPSRRAGIDVDKELSYRQQAANFIQDLGQRLRVYPFKIFHKVKAISFFNSESLVLTVWNSFLYIGLYPIKKTTFGSPFKANWSSKCFLINQVWPRFIKILKNHTTCWSDS